MLRITTKFSDDMTFAIYDTESYLATYWPTPDQLKNMTEDQVLKIRGVRHEMTVTNEELKSWLKQHYTNKSEDASGKRTAQ